MRARARSVARARARPSLRHLCLSAAASAASGVVDRARKARCACFAPKSHMNTYGYERTTVTLWRHSWTLLEGSSSYACTCTAMTCCQILRSKRHLEASFRYMYELIKYIEILPFCHILLKNPKRDAAMTRLLRCPPLSTSRASRVPWSSWTKFIGSLHTWYHHLRFSWFYFFLQVIPASQAIGYGLILPQAAIRL